MATKKFSRGEAIEFGWKMMKSNISFFIILVVVTLIISIASNISESIIRKSIGFQALPTIIYIATMVLQLAIGMGLIKIALRFCDNEKGKFTDLFSCFPLFFKYLFGSILYTLIVFVGLILLIIPGIIWGIKFQFFPYFIVDKGLGPIESLKKSSEITKGIKWDLFLFGLLLLGINLLGALCLLIGLFATIPTAMVASAFVYRKLLAQIPESSTEQINK
jgi:uncharacterized membrane protein